MGLPNLLGVLALVLAPGQDPAPDPFVPLFNGRDLTGWVPVNTAPSTWRVEDGMLRCTGKPIGELRTDRMYQNFVLEVEWRHLVPKGNAGIFVWADDITARGVPFHRSIEVQVLENAYGNTRSHTTHGDIFPIHGATMTPINGRGGSRAFPTEERSKPAPEWNHYRIECVDGAITLAVNGEVVTRGEDCVPRKGYICLESEGGVVDYRNLRIRELPDTPIDPAHVAIADRGYRSLYTGVDLSGWDRGEARWNSRDWILAFEGTRDEGGSIATEEWFGDHGLLFDVRLHEGSAPPDIMLRGVTALELPPDAFTETWNRVEIVVRDKTVEVSVNGASVDAAIEASRLRRRGPFVIVPNGRVDLANLFVREVD